jgi:hypothetical protein
VAVRIGRICSARANAVALREGRGGGAMRRRESGMDMANGVVCVMKADGKIFHANTILPPRGDTISRSVTRARPAPFLENRRAMQSSNTIAHKAS